MITTRLEIDQPEGCEVTNNLAFADWLDRVLSNVVGYCGFTSEELEIATDAVDGQFFLFAMQAELEPGEGVEVIPIQFEITDEDEIKNPVLGFWRETRPGGVK